MDRSAEEIATALGGTRNGGGWLCHCPVPTHGKRRGDLNPSLSVRDGDKCLVVHCFAGCDQRDVLDVLAKRGLLLMPQDGAGSLSVVSNSDQAAVWLAQKIWEKSDPVAGTPAEKYLRNRGIKIPIPTSIRAGRSSIKGDIFVPTMIVAVQSTEGCIVAIQQTYLTEEGTKAEITPPRRTIGRPGGGAVRVWDAAQCLGLAEGVEDALAAMQLKDIPCWATLGAPRMPKIIIPDDVGELHVFADNDEPGRKAAYETARRHIAKGRTVYVRFPPPNFKDWADVVQGARTIAA